MVEHVQHTGRGDPRRSMALLWGATPEPKRGPRPGLDVPTIVAAAIELADAEGLEAASMRRVAERLGRSAMSLYTYVPGKAELVELMLDRTIGEAARAEPAEPPGPDRWRAEVEASARRGAEWYQRHPWVLQVSTSRPLLGPNELDAFEAQLRLFDGLGLPGLHMARAVAAVAGFVRGAAQAIVEAQAAEKATGISDDDWWYARSPLLDEHVGVAWDERYPISSRLSREQAFDQVDRAPDDGTPYTVRDALDTFEFGLQRLLDGLEAHIARHRAEG